MPNSEFLWKIHAYLNEYIRFADTKAAVCIAWSSAMLGTLFSAQIHLVQKPSIWFFGCGLLSAAALIAAFLFGVLAVSPRLGLGFLSRSWVTGHTAPKVDSADPTDRAATDGVDRTSSENLGVIFWIDILQNKTSIEYEKAVSKLTDSDVAGQVAKHIYVLSGVAKRKYFFINLAMLAAAVGSVFAVVVLLAK